MPAWPGGPCPTCGEVMPENLVHCQKCRTLLNTDLDPDSVEIPVFIPLPEIATMIEVEPDGFYVGCPECRRELRIHRKYEGQKVACKFCSHPFDFLPRQKATPALAVYLKCPHCNEELRADSRYVGQRVACKHCEGKLHILVPPQPAAK